MVLSLIKEFIEIDDKSYGGFTIAQKAYYVKTILCQDNIMS